MGNVLSLQRFMEDKSKVIVQKIQDNMTPLYQAGSEPDPEELSQLLRPPMPVQKEIIKGLSKALYGGNRRKLFVVGEMGSGKTMIALSTIYLSPVPLRVLVVCPGHLVEKWKRETKITIPDCRIIDLATPRALSAIQTLKGAGRPECFEIWVISKERAKLSYPWTPAYVLRKKKRKEDIYEVPVCPDCYSRAASGDVLLSVKDLSRKRYFCSECGSPLWQASSKLRRYSIAEYIKKYIKFDMVVLDEVHDYKGGSTLQGAAMGQLAASSKYYLGLTGTLNGGYASNLFYLLYRIAPEEMGKAGWDYKDIEQWQRQHGVLEMIRKLENDEDYRYGRPRRQQVVVKHRPGVSPEAVGRHLLHRSCFIRLSDVIDGLPPYNEHVVSLEMEDEQERYYKKLEADFSSAIKRYKFKVTASMLQSLLSYPDSCVVFPEEIIVKDSNGEELDRIEAPQLSIDLLQKEKELISICKREKREGRKVLCYIVFTGRRDIRHRVQSILESQGLKVGILPETVEPKKREAWIDKHAEEFDVLLANPELVKVGLDLVQYPTVVFYQVGYNIFTLRQAARRSWRIGQKNPVNVYYLCYKDTMQETALYLVAKKVEVAMMVEGDLPEGLSRQIESGKSILEEMVNALVEGKRFTGAEAAWAQMRKRETESQLGIAQKESIFSVQERTSVKKSKNSIKDNVLITVSIIEGKKKKASKLSIKYGELDKIAKDKIVQFAMF